MKMGIFAVTEDDVTPSTLPSFTNFAVVLEEAIVLKDISDLPSALSFSCSCLIYGLDFEYPKELKYTFEVIQRRMDGSVNFYRPWNQYKRGFGATEGEYWLGLENMYQLTRNRKYMLRVDLEDFEGRKGFAQYSSFSVGPETDGYRLQVSGFKDGGAGDSLSYHNGQKFTTFDKDQDTYEKNCAEQYIGAFWYTRCYHTNPNGVYLWGEIHTHHAIGNVWYTWKKNVVGMKSIRMKIKRVS